MRGDIRLNTAIEAGCSGCVAAAAILDLRKGGDGSQGPLTLIARAVENTVISLLKGDAVLAHAHG